MSAGEQAAYAGHYTSLIAWDAGEQRDLVAADEVAIAECFNDWPSGLDEGTTSVSIDGFIVDATRYVTIRTAAGHQHTGKPGTGFWMKVDVASAALYVNDKYTVIDGIEVVQTKVSTSGRGIAVGDDGDNSKIHDCIIRNEQNGNALNLSKCDNAEVINCLAIHNTGVGISIAYTNTGRKIHNCTVIAEGACTAGINHTAGAASDIEVSNCLVVAKAAGSYSASAYNEGLATFTNSYNNAASDAETNTPPGTNPLTTNVVSTDFIDLENDDLTPVFGSALVNGGYNVGQTTDLKALSYTVGATTYQPVGAIRGVVENIKTLRASGGDYSLMSTWESSEQKDLTLVDEISVLECYNDWPSGLDDVCSVTGSIIDENRYTVIRAADGHGHDGTPDTGFRMFGWNGGGVLGGADDYARYEGLQVTQTKTNASSNSAFNSEFGDYLIIKNCILIHNGQGNGLRWAGGTDNVAYNNLVIVAGNNGIGRGFNPNYSRSGRKLLNNTIVFTGAANAGIDFSKSSGLDISNNVVVLKAGASLSTGAYNLPIADGSNSFNNAAYDGSTVTPFGTNPITTDIVSSDFFDLENDKLTPSIGSQLIGAGYDTGLTEDIKGIPYIDSESTQRIPVGAFRGQVEIVKTIKSTGGDYDTLNAWEAGEQRDLTSLDEIAVAECYAFQTASSNCTISGWTTNEYGFIHVRAAPGEEHGGVVDTGFIHYHASNAGTFGIEQDYTVVEDITVKKNHTTGSNHCISFKNSHIRINRVIADTIESPAFKGQGSSEVDAVLNNCLAISHSGGTAGGLTNYHGDVTLNNCTFASNGGNAVWNSGGNVTGNNCVVAPGYTTQAYPSGMSGTNNAAYNGSTVTPPGTNPVTVDITNSDFTDAANNDYSLASGSQLIDQGTDLSSTFTVDIAGTTRDATFDIGAFEYVSGGATVHEVSITFDVSMSDSVSGAGSTLSVTVNEAVNAGDSAVGNSIVEKSLSEGVQLDDSESSNLITDKTVTEAVSLGDSSSANMITDQSVTEGVVLDDSPSAQATVQAAVVEAIQAGYVTSASAQYNVGLSEGVQAGFQATTGSVVDVSIIEAIQAGESVTGRAIVQGNLTEAIQAGATQSSTAVINAAIQEVAQLGDSYSTGNIVAVFLTEGVGLAQSLTGNQISDVALTESFSASDVLSPAANYNVSLNESVSLSYSLAGNITIEAAITESVAMADSYDRTVEVNLHVTETAALADSLSTLTEYNVHLTENVGLSAELLTTALVNAGLTESTILSVSTVGSVIALDLVTPDGRTFTVKLEDRQLNVALDSRVFTIPKDDRVLVVPA